MSPPLARTQGKDTALPTPTIDKRKQQLQQHRPHRSSASPSIVKPKIDDVPSNENVTAINKSVQPERKTKRQHKQTFGMDVIFEMLKAQRALIQKIGNKVAELDRMVQDEEAQEAMDSDIDYDGNVDEMKDNDAGTVMLSTPDESDEKEAKSSPESVGDDVSKDKHWSSLASQRALLAEKAKGLRMNSRHMKKMRNKKARKMIEGSDGSQSNSTSNDPTDSSGDSGAEGIKRSNVAVKN